ncbi:MAG: efflux RND transporter periplasmic adaptor subunit [Motiliproteus sp.]|nr:efflux RND transporter periplasmic adaptor subunit [Motiliproteus sp.]MCW9052857.1 efflux RND transporter periplasmic adaptor subunit [Motiliproteus sp.]
MHATASFKSNLPATIFIGLLMTTLLSGCEEEQVSKPEVIRPVKTTLVEEPLQIKSRTFPGKVEASEKVELAFQVAGALTKLPVKTGQQVKKGTLLAQLDTRDYRSDLKSAEAKYKRAKADFGRAAEIFKRKLISAADVDRLRAERDVAAANVEKARKAFKDTTLKAPFDGVVASLYVDNFQDVEAKQEILSLQDNSSLDITIQVPEKLIVQGRSRDRTDEFKIVAQVETIPDKYFPMTIKEFSTQADQDTQTFKYVMTMPSPEKINVLPGMSVNVIVTPPADMVVENTMIQVPATAVFADPNGSDQQFAWIYSDGAVQKQAISIGSLRGEQVEIKEGLSPGQRIVTAGVHYLQPGQKVRLFEGKVGAN